MPGQCAEDLPIMLRGSCGLQHLQAEGDGKGVLADPRREVVIGTDRTASEPGQSKKT